jgi:hypothetical protein
MMSKRVCLAWALALVAMGSGARAQEELAWSPEVSSENRALNDFTDLGLRLQRSGPRLEGGLESSQGRLAFSSTAQPDGRVTLEYELPQGRGALVLLVDREAQTAEVFYPEGLEIGPADRAAFRALALALGSSPRDDSPEADLLLRAARLWGDHPLQPVRLTRIVAPFAKSWTNLCGITSRSLAHDGTTHGLISETLAVGPNASNCRARCGAGCDALVGTSAWTVDCGEHDRCEQHHSCCTSCQDEFNSASDDYLFASNCRLSGW